jgi:hypothetical protein
MMKPCKRRNRCFRAQAASIIHSVERCLDSIRRVRVGLYQQSKAAFERVELIDAGPIKGGQVFKYRLGKITLKAEKRLVKRPETVGVLKQIQPIPFAADGYDAGSIRDKNKLVDFASAYTGSVPVADAPLPAPSRRRRIRKQPPILREHGGAQNRRQNHKHYFFHKNLRK